MCVLVTKKLKLYAVAVGGQENKLNDVLWKVINIVHVYVNSI